MNRFAYPATKGVFAHSLLAAIAFVSRALPNATPEEASPDATRLSHAST